MAKRERDKTGGRRSEIVTVRFDPKLKYLAELAARKQRRPLSSFIEWAVERNLEQVVLQEDFAGDKTTVFDAQRIYQLWDLDDSDRVIRLALHFPDLLTHDEQLIWKHVRECGYLWTGKYSGDPPEWKWVVKLDAIIWDRLREYWPIFKAVAEGTKSVSDLPSWRKMDAPSSIDDDIPF
jgi:hypothetical protein